MASSCKDAWERFRKGQIDFKEINAAFADCKCEDCSASPHSPGLISDSEILIRRHYIPIHFSKIQRQYTRAAYVDLYKRGMSVNRKPYATRDFIHQQAMLAIEQSKESGRTPKTGYVLAVSSCGHLRKLRFEDGSRIFCIYDTATIGDQSHVDIVAGKFGDDLPKSVKLEIIDNAINNFKIREPDEVFSDLPK